MGGGGLSKYFLNLLAFITFKKLLKIEFISMRGKWGFISRWGDGGGGGSKNRMYFICLQVDGPITEGGGEGPICGSLRRYSNVTRLLH